MTEIQELLKPRYKLLAPFFFMEEMRLEVGMIVYVEKLEIRNRVFDLSKYPHLFRKLEWWEERKPSEMPEYVKYWDTSYMFPVERVCLGKDAPLNSNEFTASNFLPATKEEYEIYNNQNK